MERYTNDVVLINGQQWMGSKEIRFIASYADVCKCQSLKVNVAKCKVKTGERERDSMCSGQVDG